MTQELSLHEVFAIYNLDPQIRRRINLRAVRDPKSFLEILMEDIEEAIEELQTKRDLFNKEDVNEDLITTYVISNLNGKGHDASHDNKDGGHVDVTIINKNCNIKWKAEAKIFNGEGYIYKGWEQLTKRYLAGNKTDSVAGMLIYCFKDNAKSRLASWLAHLSSLESIQQSILPCGLRADTNSILHGSGTQIQVRHFMINLYFPTTSHRAA